MKFLVKTAFAVLLAFGTILCACSTISSRQTLAYPFPPRTHAEEPWGKTPVEIDHELEKQLANEQTEPMRLLVRYQQAKLWTTIDPSKSCALWLEVLNQPKFPLLGIARIHAMETCPADRLAIASIDEVIAKTSEPWLKEVLTRASLTRAERTQDKAWEMKLSFDVTAFEKTQTTKVKRLQRTLQLAGDLNDSEMAAKATTRLNEVAPRLAGNVAPPRYFDVAMDFRRAREFDKARQWYRRILDGEEFSSWEKLKALDGTRMTYKLEKKTALYLQATQSYSEFAHKNFLRPAEHVTGSARTALLTKYLDAQLNLARAVWTENSAKEADLILVKTERDIGRRVSVAESVFTRARIDEEAGRFSDAIKKLQGIDVDTVSNSDLRAKILWGRAWNMRKVGRNTEAASAFQKLVTNAGAQALPRDRFWLARTLKETGNTALAVEQFDWLIDNDPMGWYGLLSYRELQKPIPSLNAGRETRTPASKDVNAADSSLMPEERLTLEWLISAGETDLAKSFLDDTTADRRSGYTEGQTVDLLKQYARAGSYQTLFTRLYELPAPARKKIVDSEPDLLFPQPWKNVVSAASKKFDVQSELIYAIMRQESAFNPFARSPADAFGLLQLIPEAAKHAAPATGLKINDVDDLYLPENNIALGAAFMRGLLDHWKNRFVPTVASYNASESAIAGWLKTRLRNDPLEFIEDIPYEETRNYIKLVTRNFIFYRRLNAGTATLDFPEQCLSDLQGVKL